WLDVQLAQEGSLGGTDFVTLLDQSDLIGNFDLTLDDLGGDLKDLEERGLTRVTSGGSRGNGDIDRGDGSNSGRGGNLVGKDQVLDLSQVGVGEYESDVAGDFIDEALEGMSLVLLKESIEDLSDEGVLSHQ